jgi:hypothetical protein
MTLCRKTLQSDQLALTPDHMDGQSVQHNQFYVAVGPEKQPFACPGRGLSTKKRNITSPGWFICQNSTHPPSFRLGGTPQKLHANRFEHVLSGPLFGHIPTWGVRDPLGGLEAVMNF